MLSLTIYADDSLLYVSFASGDSAATVDGLQACLASVQLWMPMNKLKLNADKTEFFIGNEWQQSTNMSHCFPLSFSMSKLIKQNLLEILEWILMKI